MPNHINPASRKVRRSFQLRGFRSTVDVLFAVLIPLLVEVRAISYGVKFFPSQRIFSQSVSFPQAAKTS